MNTSDSWSFESRQSSSYWKKDITAGVNMVDFNRRKNIILTLIGLFAFLTFVIGFTMPKNTTRKIAYSIVRDILEKRFRISCSAIINSTVSTFYSYETVSKYILSLSTETKMMNCSEESMRKFIEVSNSAIDILQPKISWTILSDFPTSLCFSSYDNASTDPTHFYYAVPIGNGSLRLKQYDYPVHLENFDSINNGTSLYLCDNFFNSIYSVVNNTNEPQWLFSTFENQIHMVSVAHNWIGNNLSSFAAVGFTIQELGKEMARIASKVSTDFLVITSSNQVVIDYTRGELNTHSFVPLSVFKDSFWDIFKDNISSSSYGQTFYFNNDSNSFLFFRKKFSYSNAISLTLFLVYNIDDEIAHSLYQPTLIYILCFCSIILVLFLLAAFQQWIHKQKEKKLKKLPKVYLSTNSNQVSLPQVNILSSIISQVRQLELSYPEDNLLNKTLDNVAFNLSLSTKEMFACYSTCDCSFCSHLETKHNKSIETHDTSSYSLWFRLLPEKLQSYDFSHDFVWRKHKDQPIQMFLKLLISIMKRENVLITRIDPDIILEFFHIFAREHIEYITYSSLILYKAHNIISSVFKNWIQSPMNVYIVIIVAIIRSVASCYINPEEIIANSISLYEKLTCFRTTKTSLQIYFENTFQEILFGTEKRNTMSILGEMRIRMESPDFSVQNHQSDRELFMKFVVFFSLFAPYYSSIDTMNESLKLTNQITFDEKEILDSKFVSEYHFEVSSKIVFDWIRLMKSFSPMKKEDSYLKQVIEFWSSKLKNKE